MQSILATQKPIPGTPLRLGHWSTEGLGGFWSMREGRGDRTFDLSGSGRDAIITPGGSGSWQPAKFGNGYYFNNTGYATISNPAPAAANGQTRLCWYKADTIGLDGLLGSIGWANGEIVLRLSTNVAQILVNAADDGTASAAYTSTGVWTCFVGVYRPSGECEIWIDGVLSGTDTASANYSFSGPEQIGTEYDQGRIADGIIDHCAYWSRDLSASEIPQLHREPFLMFAPEWMSVFELASQSVGGVTVPVMYHHYQIAAGAA